MVARRDIFEILASIGVPQDSELGARIIRANPVFIEDGQKLEGVSESDRDALRSYAEAKVAEIMAAWKPFIDG